VPFKCGVLATAWICWHCHRQILPAIFTTLRSGVNSVWATVFGRLLSIACGNIVPFKVREPAFAGVLCICSRAASFDPLIRSFHLIRSDSCTVRICLELFRELLSLYNQVSPLKSPAFLCASFVRGYPLVGFSSLVPPSNRFLGLRRSIPLDKFTYPPRFIALARMAGPAETSFNALLHADSDFNLPDSDAEVVAALAAYGVNFNKTKSAMAGRIASTSPPAFCGCAFFCGVRWPATPPR
jgi:hypothetical protein